MAGGGSGKNSPHTKIYNSFKTCHDLNGLPRKSDFLSRINIENKKNEK